MSEISVSMSVWLPVAAANFYSATANGWLKKESGTYYSEALQHSGYVPRLQVSVLRRLLEVLPLSFGYDSHGRCEMSSDVDDLARPVSVTMALEPAADLATMPAGPQAWANLELLRQRVQRVTLRVDEHGAYSFVAVAGAGADEGGVRAALRRHILEVFGGDYSLDRLSYGPRRRNADNEGSAAVKRYNGIAPESQAVVSAPRGILTFFQLNTLVEGLFNESMSPAVFLEQNTCMTWYFAQPHGSTSVLRTMREVIDTVAVDVDAGHPDGLVVALRRFLDATSREVLQRLKWSVESVRRSLLDEMMSMMHRQSRLVQLNLGASRRERTPELAEGASESQLRGYVLLMAAKLPLVTNVYDIAMLARDHLGDAIRADPALRDLDDEVERLKTQLRHWHTLLQGLRNNVQGLEGAIEHAWRERILYEQQQVRSEQEAMAEIERSRTGRPTAERASRSVYNFVMLVLTAAAVLLTIKTGNILQIDEPDTNWWVTLQSLWPIGLLAIVAYLVVPAFGRVMRLSREKRGQSDSYPYEFAFGLEEAADPVKVHAYLSAKRRRKPESSLRKLALTNRGGGRIERVSLDRTLVKIHSIASFRVGFGSYARFEIVHEILAHKVSARIQYLIVQCRVFGDSPRPLPPQHIMELVRIVLTDIGTQLSLDGSVDVPSLVGLVDPLYTGVSVGSDPSDGDDDPADERDDENRLRVARAGDRLAVPS